MAPSKIIYSFGLTSYLDTTMDDSHDELFYGPVVAAKMKEFKKAVADIEAKHQQFFADQDSPYAPEDAPRRATLEEYLIVQYDAHRAAIGFQPELPTDIAEETRAEFMRIMST